MPVNEERAETAASFGFPRHEIPVGNNLDLWIVATGISEGEAAISESFLGLSLRSQVHENEMDALRSIANPSARQRSMVSRGLRRILLSAYTGLPADQIRFSSGAHGKPRIDSLPLQFNTSISQEYWAMGIGNSPLGIDLEIVAEDPDEARLRRLRGRRTRVQEFFFLPEEHAYLEAIRDDRDWRSEFLRLWTRKEACVKAWGEAIASHSLCVDSLRDFQKLEGRSWELRTFELDSASIRGLGKRRLWLSVCSRALPNINFRFDRTQHGGAQ